MLNLPEYVLLEIFSFLSPSDLCKSILLANKEFYSLIKSSSFLTTAVIRNSFGLSTNNTVDFALFQQLAHKLHYSPAIELNFKGFATSGGYDEDQAQYWVGNLYKNDGSYYCSRDNRMNINTAGVLENALSLEEENCEYILKILREVEIIANSIYPRFKKKNTLGPTIKRSFRQLFTTYRQEIVKIVSDSFGEAENDVNRKITMELKQMKFEEVDSVKFKRRFEDMYVMHDGTDTDLADRSKIKAIISEVEVSREGGFTCPLQTFVVLCSEKYVDIEDEEFGKYNDLLCYEQVAEAFPNGVNPLVISELSQFCTFRQQARRLKPLAWGKFVDSKSKIITIPLEFRTAGNYLYLKMINPENRMAAMNDNHDFPNIDCNYVVGRGHVVSFNS